MKKYWYFVEIEIEVNETAPDFEQGNLNELALKFKSGVWAEEIERDIEEALAGHGLVGSAVSISEDFQSDE